MPREESSQSKLREKLVAHVLTTRCSLKKKYKMRVSGFSANFAFNTMFAAIHMLNLTLNTIV